MTDIRLLEIALEMAKQERELFLAYIIEMALEHVQELPMENADKAYRNVS